MKLTIACDFDGVVHSYTSPWTKVLDINDPPVPGAIEWLTAVALDPEIRVIIHSCRFAMEPEAAWYWEATPLRPRIRALQDWLHHHGMTAKAIAGVEVWAYKGKPHATVYLDDRGFRFEGDFPSPEALRALKQWNKP